MAFANAVLSWLGEQIGHNEIDFYWLLSKLFIPLAWAMGIPWDECMEVAKVLATKFTINEFEAYKRLRILISTETLSVSNATTKKCEAGT